MKLNTSSNAGILIIIALKLIIKIIGYFLDRMQNIDHIRQKAEKGDVESQFGMAWSYAKGLGGVEENHNEAVRWYHIAAENGHPQAAFNLGWCYDNGFGCKENNKEAIKWYLKSAETGYEEGLYYAGLWHLCGERGLNDKTTGARYLEKLIGNHSEHSQEARITLARYYWKEGLFEKVMSVSSIHKSDTIRTQIALLLYQALALLEQKEEKAGLQRLQQAWIASRIEPYMESILSVEWSGPPVVMIDYCMFNMDKNLPPLSIKSLTPEIVAKITQMDKEKFASFTLLKGSDASLYGIYGEKNGVVEVLTVGSPELLKVNVCKNASPEVISDMLNDLANSCDDETVYKAALQWNPKNANASATTPTVWHLKRKKRTKQLRWQRGPFK